MPIGVICDAAVVAVGGLLGTFLGGRLSDKLRNQLYKVFGLCSMGIGVSSIVLMKNLPAVVLALILGTLLGTAIHLSDLIRRGGMAMERGIRYLMPASSSRDHDESLLITAIVLFCASGTGIYGSIVSGMSGDHSILLAKSVLDLFTAFIFACTLGPVTACISIPQCGLFLLLFFLSGFLFPLTTPAMFADFKSCGGFIMLATGFCMTGLLDFPIADMIPAMFLVWPFSWALKGIFG